MKSAEGRDPCEDHLSVSFAVLTAFIVTTILFLHAIYIHYPIVMGDEAIYALHSKYLYDPRFAATKPDILYFCIYHIASWFRENHLIVVKLLNAGFFGCALFPLYATARRFLSTQASWLFSLVLVFSPISSYSVYEMPESMYFFVFWMLVYTIVVQVPRSLLYGGLYAGFAVAALSAVKPHGLVLTVTVPVVMVCLYYRGSNETRIDQLGRALLGYLAAFVVARCVISYLVRGDVVIELFGDYARYATPYINAGHGLIRPGLWHTIRGHLSLLAVVFWPTIVVVLWPFEASQEKNPADSNYIALSAFSLTTLVLLIGMLAQLTRGLDMAGRACRLHGRYYDFALGTLVLLFLAGTNSANGSPRHPKLFGVVVIGGAVAAAIAAYFAFFDYCATVVDFPEIFWLAVFRSGLTVGIVGSIASAASLAYFSQRTSRIVYLAFLSFVALTTSVAVFVGQMRSMSPPPPVDLAAIAVRNLIPNQIDNGVVIARNGDLRSYRAMFQLYSLSEQKFLDQPVLTKEDIPSGRKWALLLEPYTLNLPYYSVLRIGDFVFLQLAPGGIVAIGGGALTSR